MCVYIYIPSNKTCFKLFIFTSWKFTWNLLETNKHSCGNQQEIFLNMFIISYGFPLGPFFSLGNLPAGQPSHPPTLRDGFRFHGLAVYRILVGGWTTQLKNISQNGSFPQVGAENKNVWNHHLDVDECFFCVVNDIKTKIGYHIIYIIYTYIQTCSDNDRTFIKYLSILHQHSSWFRSIPPWKENMTLHGL